MIGIMRFAILEVVYSVELWLRWHCVFTISGIVCLRVLASLSCCVLPVSSSCRGEFY